MIDLPILLPGNMWSDPGNILIAHRPMNVNIGTEAAQFPEKEYINGIFVAVLNFVVAHLLIFRAFYTLPVLETNH
jgi:hypothetical protein